VAEAVNALVLIIDDKESERGFADLVSQQGGVDAVFLLPDDIDDELLQQADLVVTDQYLDDWPGRDERPQLPTGLRVPDGLSLAAVLRAQVDRSGDRRQPARPVAFVLRTGELVELAGHLPEAARGHLLAATYNLEWVMSKDVKEDPPMSVPDPAARVAQLARAVANLPADWGPSSGNPGHRWLSMPSDAGWWDTAAWQIEQCRPPQHVLASRSHGIAWLRWFLHRVLPYPTFLLDQRGTALYLGLTDAALAEVLDSSSRLKSMLDGVAYTGNLSDFAGRRWWRAGLSFVVEQLADLIGVEELLGPTEIAAAADEVHGTRLEHLLIERPVTVIDASYSVVGPPADAADCVRLQPDDWPPYADDVYALASRVAGPEAEPDLAAMVVSTERWVLP
jgi:hypothetical protein